MGSQGATYSFPTILKCLAPGWARAYASVPPKRPWQQPLLSKAWCLMVNGCWSGCFGKDGMAWFHNSVLCCTICTYLYIYIYTYVHRYIHTHIIIVIRIIPMIWYDLFHWLLHLISGTRCSPGWGPWFDVFLSGFQPRCKTRGCSSYILQAFCLFIKIFVVRTIRTGILARSHAARTSFSSAI